MEKTKSKPFLKIAILIFVVGCIAGLVRYAYSVPSIKEAIDLATTVKPETFTELYFEDHQNLPSVLVPGKPETIRFTVHNLEYKPMTYQVSVSAKTATETNLIATGEFKLAHDAYKTITQEFTLTEATRTAVIVKLDNLNQYIQVWLDPNNQ